MMIESRTAQRNILVSVILAATLLLGCGRGGTSPPPSPAVSPTPLVTPNPLLPTPQIAQLEEPLQGAPKYPDVFLLTVRAEEVGSGLFPTYHGTATGSRQSRPARSHPLGHAGGDPL